MKKIFDIIPGIIIVLIVFITCKPEPVNPPPLPPQSPPTAVNRPPVAVAGKDTSINLSSCGGTASISLDGRTSSDPDNSPLTYLWRVIFAPNNRYRISNSRAAQMIIADMIAGEYVVELAVADPLGLTALDTVVVTVNIPSGGTAYDFDITINGTFRFQDNYSDCYYCYPCCYYDFSYIDNAAGYFAPFGDFYFYANEESDSATTSNSHTTHFGMNTYNHNISVNGPSSINLKNVFQTGGGSFNGTFTPVNGSALNCDATIFINLAPLTVTGTLDTTSHSITLNIKGKIFF